MKYTLPFVFLLLIACNRQPPKPLTPGFYYWRTTLSLPPAQQQYLADASCRKLYVKVADIGLESGSREIVPYTRLSIHDTSGLSRLELIPVVFITNEVFREIKPDKLLWLAEKVAALQNELISFPKFESPEFQVDCDWTAGTRAQFFHFLELLKPLLAPNTCLSATIRLHQYKFPDKTGIPPADRGILMCYNTGDIDDPATSNSIFNTEDVKKYTQGAPRHYPLPLDLALPAYAWLLVYRNDELWKIIPGRHAQIPDGLLERGTFLNGHYLRPGDHIRREVITGDLLKTAAALTASLDLAEDASIVFFQLDDATPGDYPAPLIKTICQIADAHRKR